MKKYQRLFWPGRLLVLLGLFIWGFGIPATVAQAHANLVRSVPDIGALLAQAPKEVMLEFSEDLDPSFSQVRLLNASSQVVVNGPGTIDPGSRRVLRLALPPLADGSYSAVWQARSAADGHLTNGSVGFSVGKVDPAVSLLPDPSLPTPTRTLPPLADTVLRWLSYLALAIFGGSLSFALLVWRPAYRQWKAPAASEDEALTRLLMRLNGLGAASLALISIASVVYEAYSSSRGTQLTYGQSVLSLTGLRDGWTLWLRLALLGISAGLVRRYAPSARMPLWSQVILLIPLLGVIATFSLKSHAASLGSALPVAADMLHLSAMCAWFGGLLPLFISLRGRRRLRLPAASLVPAFSRVGLASFSILAVTGLYSAVLQVQTLDALLGTYYGLALIVKVGLFGVLIGLGALNLLIFSPRIKAGAAGIVRRLSRSVQVELLVGTLLLSVVGILTGVSPAYQALQAEHRLGYVDQYQQGGTALKLWVAPGIAGDDEIAVDVTGAPPSPSGQKAQVLLRFQMMDEDMGITQAVTSSQDGKRYTARGSYLSMAGNWQIDVILRNPGVNDIRHLFPVTVQGNPNESGLPNPVPASPASIASGAALYQDNCLLCHGVSGKGDGPVGLALNPHPADLSVHALPGVHTDGQLFLWISQGYPGSAMPPFDPALTDQQRWDLVNFIRTLAQKK